MIFIQKTINFLAFLLACFKYIYNIYIYIYIYTYTIYLLYLFVYHIRIYEIHDL